MKSPSFIIIILLLVIAIKDLSASNYYEGPDYSFFDNSLTPSPESGVEGDRDSAISSRVRRDRDNYEHALEPSSTRLRTNIDNSLIFEIDGSSSSDSSESDSSDSEDEIDYPEEEGHGSEDDLENDNANNGEITESDLEEFDMAFDSQDDDGEAMITLEEADDMAVSNRIAGLEAGREEALRKIGPYVVIGEFFRKRDDDKLWKPGEDVLNIELSEGEELSVSEAMSKFKNISADNIFERNIKHFIFLAKFANLEIMNMSDKKIMKAVAKILVIK